MNHAHYIKKCAKCGEEFSENPGHGHGKMDRGFGWMIGVATYAASRGDSIAAKWLSRALQAYSLAIDSAGVAQREYHAPYMPSGIQGTQHFHTAITHAAAIRAAIYLAVEKGDPAPLETVLADVEVWAGTAFANPSMPLQERADGPGTFGPPKWWWRWKDGVGELRATLANSSGPDTGFQEHCLAVLGLAAQACEKLGRVDDVAGFLTDGLGVGAPAISLAAKLSSILSYRHDLGQEASYASAIQNSATAGP